ncbi:MAG: radical SAM family heme chaperone HemW [Dehalococcoidia bacterium]|nr:radical SAM family heme chaperone HemW [Dehalococcoidia bacterium]
MSTPLAVYIHVPFCRSRCNYCSFISFTGRQSDIPNYVAAVAHEIALRTVTDAVVTTIYFGGGTPSLLPAGCIGQLLHVLRNHYHITDDAEITMEANPGTIDLEYLTELRRLGVKRLSLGVQSLDTGELKLLGRVHTAHEAKTAITQAKQAGFDNISLDFIYGLPGRNTKLWKNMLCTITNLGMQHLSLYGLTIEDGTTLQKRIKSGELAAVDNDSAATEYELASEMLPSAGLRQYEISNWALPGYESRHNTAYWKRTHYIGLGVAAHSFLNSQRIANTSSLDEYLSHLSHAKLPPQTIENIDPATALAESIILGLRLCQGVSADDIQAQFGIDLYKRFASPIEECSSYGLLERHGSVLRLTQRGRLLSNEVFWRFLP